MAQRTQQWRPDTCGCLIIQTFDDADYAGTVQNVLSMPCEMHANVQGSPAAAAVENNQRKNRLYRRLFEAFQADMFEQDARGEWQMKASARFDWSFTGIGDARVLTVAITGLSNAKKAQAQTWCDTNLGAGKVVIT